MSRDMKALADSVTKIINATDLAPLQEDGNEPFDCTMRHVVLYLTALVDTFRQIVRTEQARHVNALASGEFDWRFEQGGESACHSILTKMAAAEAAKEVK